MLSHSTGMALKEGFVWIWLALVIGYTSIIFVIAYFVRLKIMPKRCKICGTEKEKRDRIPIISYIRLRGKCRHCQSPIPLNIVYLIIEAILVVIAMKPAVYVFINGFLYCAKEVGLFGY
jgi:prepilin signal peptidase PulO-like enzyme (type II secretory pathway)